MIFISSQGYITDPPSKSKAGSRDIKSAIGTTCQCFSNSAFSHLSKSPKNNFLILLSDSHHSCDMLSKIKPTEAALLCFPSSALPEGEKERGGIKVKNDAKICHIFHHFQPLLKAGCFLNVLPFFFFFLL